MEGDQVGVGDVHVCVEGGREGMGTCTCTCVYGEWQGGDGDMYMCVWRGCREDIGTCTCVCGGGPGRGWGHVHVCVEGGQGGYRDMYIIWLYVICNKRYLKKLLPAEFIMCQIDPKEF